MHTRLFAGQREWPSSYDWRDDGLPDMEKVINVTTNLVSLYITILTALCGILSSSAVDRRIDKPKTL